MILLLVITQIASNNIHGISLYCGIFVLQKVETVKIEQKTKMSDQINCETLNGRLA